MSSKIARLLAPMGFALLPVVLHSPARAAEPAAAPVSVRSDIALWLEDAETKLEELASATPEAKYRWRPAKGVRSTGEVFVHVITSNYGIPSFAGVKPPEGFDPDAMEKSLTKKADIEKALKDSFAHVKKALAASSDADLAKPLDLFGNNTTIRGAYLLVLSHAHEHLGQSIAYARSNHIEPPWTARQHEKSDDGGGKEGGKKSGKDGGKKHE